MFFFFCMFHYHQQNASPKRYKYGLTMPSTIPPSFHTMFILTRIFYMLFSACQSVHEAKLDKFEPS